MAKIQVGLTGRSTKVEQYMDECPERFEKLDEYPEELEGSSYATGRTWYEAESGRPMGVLQYGVAHTIAELARADDVGAMYRIEKS